MTIDKLLEKALRDGKLPSNTKTGGVVVITKEVTEVSDYLTQEKIRHCSLPKHGVVIIGYATYAEMKKIDDTYNVTITNKLLDSKRNSVFEKLDVGFGFDLGWLKGVYRENSPTQDVSNVKDEKVAGTIIHTKRFNRTKYHGVEELTSDISTFKASFETLFDIALDSNVKSICANTRRKLM